MRNWKLSLAALTLAAPLLGGCQSMFDTARKGPVSAPPTDQDFAAAQLEKGKRALDSRQYGLALIAFRNAQRFEAQAAAAHNGMAIAYAQIGRPDLAERYFKQAIGEAPGERRFHANLENFYRDWPEVAVRTVRPEVLAMATPAMPGPAMPELPASELALATRAVTAPMQATVQMAPVVQPLPAQPADATIIGRIQAALKALPAAGRRLAPRAAQARAGEALAPVRRTASATAARATIRIEMPQANPVRISANEVRISAPPSAPPLAPKRRDPGLANFGPALAKIARVNTAYPARVVLQTRP